MRHDPANAVVLMSRRMFTFRTSITFAVLALITALAALLIGSRVAGVTHHRLYSANSLKLRLRLVLSVESAALLPAVRVDK